jgi:hypothetical protein
MHNINRRWSTPFLLSSCIWQRTIISMLCTQYTLRIRKRERERKETTTQVGRMTNEPDSSLLFCSEEQSSRLSLCNYHHHIVHAPFPLDEKKGDGKSVSLPFTLCMSLLHHTTYQIYCDREKKRKRTSIDWCLKETHSFYDPEIVSFSIITQYVT